MRPHVRRRGRQHRAEHMRYRDAGPFEYSTSLSTRVSPPPLCSRPRIAPKLERVARLDGRGDALLQFIQVALTANESDIGVL